DARAVAAAHAQTGAAAVMLARGALGNPWLFAEVLGERSSPPAGGEVLTELDWVMDRAVEHLGPDRAGRYLRKFYPWYVERLRLAPRVAKALQQRLQEPSPGGAARGLCEGVGPLTAAA